MTAVHILERSNISSVRTDNGGTVSGVFTEDRTANTSVHTADRHNIISVHTVYMGTIFSVHTKDTCHRQSNALAKICFSFTTWEEIFRWLLLPSNTQKIKQTIGTYFVQLKKPAQISRATNYFSIEFIIMFQTRGFKKDVPRNFGCYNRQIKIIWISASNTAAGHAVTADTS